MTERAGNCTEQSAIAYEFLRHAGVHGVAWMGLNPPYDHVFIVMGLTTQPPTDDSFTLGGGPPASWGPGAVVCDPYFGTSFYAQSDWRAKVRDFFPGLNLPDGTVVAIRLRAYIR
jgi:hypothetical protein